MQDTRRLWLLFNILTCALIVDVIISKMFPVVGVYSNSIFWIYTFVALALTIILSQFVILFFARSKALDVGLSSKTVHMSSLNKILAIIQVISYSIIAFCIFQMFSEGEYATSILSIITTISFSLEVFILGLLTFKLVNWYRLNKSFILWMFILSSSSIAISGILINIQINILFENSLSSVSKNIPGIFPALAGNTLIEVLQGGYFVFSVVSFTLMWLTTSFLLYHYSSKMGIRKYWLLVVIPLVFYLSQFIFLNTDIFLPLINSNPFFYIILLNTLYSMSLPIGGALFAISFLTMAKTVGKDNPIVQNYLKFSAYGILLVFIASQTTITRLNFPPFGIMSVSVIGLAAYILFIGLYSSAISASIDRKLLQSIREATIQKARFLHNIAEAEVIGAVLKVAKNEEEKLKEETGIESSLSEEDTQEYLQKILLEMQKTRNSEN